MERARFGIFDFSASTGELRRNGVIVRLQAQPARVLAVLVARAGQVVSRDTLQREIWGDGTHVDFERGLNFCIAQVRSALGDSADTPRFIETVPKQGYRFIAPLHLELAQPGVARTETAVDRAETQAPPPPTGAGSRLAWTATVLLVLVALGIVGRSAAMRLASTPPTVAVIPFYNETGRPELDPLARSIGDAAIASLAAPARTSALSVIGNAASLKNPFARQDVQQTAHDLGAGWVLIGQLKADDTGLRVIAHLIRVSDMKHLWAHTFDDAAFSLDAQTRTGDAIAAAVAGSFASIE